jgi:hypothetical protein
LHLNCGTSLEACLAGKLPVSMEFLNTERLLRHTPLPSRVSFRAGSREELDTLVKNPRPFQERYDADKVYRDNIEPWFYKRDGDAHRRTSRVLTSGAVRGFERRGADYGAALRGSFSAPSWLQRAQGAAAFLLGSRAVSALRQSASRAKASKRIGVDDVRRNLERIARVKGRAFRGEVMHARHPLHGVAMASVAIIPGSTS